MFVNNILKKAVILLGCIFPIYGLAQQPQTQTDPIYLANAKYTNGVAPGYWPTAGSGLTLNLGAGTANCAGIITYSAGTLTMTASTTNYVYLNTSSSCAPAVKTTAFTTSDIPIAVVTTSGSAITAIFDVRTMFNTPSGVAYPPAGIPSSTGSAWGTSYSAQGTDTALLTAGTVSGTAASLCTDSNGGATTSGCPTFGTTTNPTTCTANSATAICITLAPYYASNQGGTTTTSSSISSGSSSTTVGSCSTFTANEYVLIPGAGAAGANFLAPLVSCTGTTMTWTGATSTTVTSVTILHDESNAIQAAITALASTGGNIYFPDGVYLVNGPLQDTSGANSILLMPSIASLGNSTTTRFIGFKEPASLANSVQPTGAVIQNTLGSSGNILSGYCHSSCSELSFTNAGIDMEYLTILAPTNPSISAINAGWISTARFYHVAVGTGNSSLPTNTATGILFPYAGNDVRLSSTDLYVSGYGTCVQTGEHTTILELGESSCIKGIVPQSRASTPYAGNIQHIVHAWCQLCTYQLAAGPNVATIKIDSLDIESATTNGVYDPSNLLYGDVGFNVQASFGAVTPTNPAVSGASNLCIHNIQFPNAATFGGACPAAGGVQTVTGASPIVVSPTGGAVVVSCPTCASGAAGAMVNITPSLTWTGCTVSGYQCNANLAGSTITVSGIPSGYSKLHIDIDARSNDSSGTGVTIEYNSDSGNNYSIEGMQVYANGSPAVFGGTGLGGPAFIGVANGSGSQAGTAAQISIDISQYAGSSVKSSLVTQGDLDAGSFNNASFRTAQFYWNNTAAITSISFVNASSWQFITPTNFRVYGIQ